MVRILPKIWLPISAVLGLLFSVQTSHADTEPIIRPEHELAELNATLQVLDERVTIVTRRNNEIQQIFEALLQRCAEVEPAALWERASEIHAVTFWLYQNNRERWLPWDYLVAYSYKRQKGKLSPRCYRMDWPPISEEFYPGSHRLKKRSRGD